MISTIPVGLDRKEAKIFSSLDAERLPKHIAIIMDGNGRWAKRRHLPRIAGHKVGVESVRSVAEAASNIGIKALTLYAFSAENWQRPETEVNFLMRSAALLSEARDADVPEEQHSCGIHRAAA